MALQGRESEPMTKYGVDEAIVYASTKDGLQHAGLIIRPDENRFPSAAVLWIHGSGMSFGSQPYVDLGRDVAARGLTFLTGNTRGHDGLALMSRGDEIVAGGSAWELYEEAPLDISAWLDALRALGVDRVALAGHSLGGAKVVHFQAQQPDPRVAGIILASPPVEIPEFPERVALARQMVDTGRGEELLPHAAGTPPWNVVSARTVVSRELVIRPAFARVPGEPSIQNVRCPILAFYGTSEVATTEALDTIRRNAVNAECQTETIQNADHDYTGRTREVARTIVGWLRNLLPQAT